MAFESSYFQKRFWATSRGAWALPGLLNSSCICYLHFGLIDHPFCKDDNSTEWKFKPNDKQQPANVSGEKAFYTSRLCLRPIYLLGVWSIPLADWKPTSVSASFHPGNEVDWLSNPLVLHLYAKNSRICLLYRHTGKFLVGSRHILPVVYTNKCLLLSAELIR